jgi:hypothetical protein
VIPADLQRVNYYLQTHDLLKGRATNRELITGLRSALDQSYSRMLKAASDKWQRQFGGKEPSDSCVSVRISSGRPPQESRVRGRSPLRQLPSGA